jgi:hypothetical protein
MQWLRLNEGPGNGVVLPIAPTMKYLTYKGEKYFRMPDSRACRHRGRCRHFGGSYLWAAWTPVPR